MNLEKAPTHKLADRRDILERVLTQLLASEDCYRPTHTWQKSTPDQIANWEARETVSNLAMEFPRQADPVAPVIEAQPAEAVLA